MKKRLGQFLMLLCLICLWGCLCGFSIKSTAPFLYERGEWDGEICGTYEGPLSDQFPCGSATLTFQHGGAYVGSFDENGHPSGRGTYTFANGESVSGDFSWDGYTEYVMEKPLSGDTPHYNGTDMIYEGMMLDGEPCGFGTLDFRDGGTFYGEFLNGTVKGKGVYVYLEADPTTQVTGSDWSFVSRSTSNLGGRWYTGLLSGMTWQGYGMLCYNYSYYVGEVKDNLCHGHGTYWQWSQSGDPSGTMTRKDYGHYNSGNLQYACSHSDPILGRGGFIRLIEPPRFG